MNLAYFDYFIMLILSVILIIGAYQFYFWTQRNVWLETKSLYIKADDWFDYNPHWSWVYSFLYYPVIVGIILTLNSYTQFAYTALSFIILLFAQMACFLFYPVEIPAEWRQFNHGNLSEKFLLFVQKFDQSTNCFPSMHVSVATLTALHIGANYTPASLWIWLFPVLIGYSAIKTKQHYLLDIIPGAGLGWAVYYFWKGYIYVV